jgi:hypothetical protein
MLHGDAPLCIQWPAPDASDKQQPHEPPSTFQLVRLWVQAPEADPGGFPSFAAAPCAVVPDDSSAWRFSVVPPAGNGGPPALPAGVLTAVRLPCVYATAGRVEGGEADAASRALDAAGGRLQRGWLVLAGRD